MSSYLSRKQFIGYVREYLYEEMQHFDRSLFKAEQISRTIKRMGYAVNTELARIHDFDKTTERLDIVLTCNPENFDSKKRIETCLGIITRSKFVCALAALRKLKSFGTRQDLYSKNKRLEFNNGTIAFTDLRAGSFTWNSLNHIHMNLLKLLKLQAQVSKFENSTHVEMYKSFASECIHFGHKPVEFKLSASHIIVDIRRMNQFRGDNGPILELIKELFDNIGLSLRRTSGTNWYYELNLPAHGPGYIAPPPSYKDFKMYIDEVFVMPKISTKLAEQPEKIEPAKDSNGKLQIKIEETMAFIKADIETVNKSIQTLENELKSKRIILAGLKEDLHGFERFHPLSIRY